MNQNRREFLKTMAALPLAGAVSAPLAVTPVVSGPEVIFLPHGWTITHFKIPQELLDDAALGKVVIQEYLQRETAELDMLYGDGSPEPTGIVQASLVESMESQC